MNKNTKETAPRETSEIRLKFLEDPELLLQVAGVAAETAESIQDIPLQIELLSRVTLAKSFISLQHGKASFDQATFENVWRFLTLQVDAPTENPSK